MKSEHFDVYFVVTDKKWDVFASRTSSWKARPTV